MKGSTVVPGVTETSPVPELMKFLRNFRDNQFTQVEMILSNRENVLRTELEQLRKQYHVMEEERNLMVKKHALTEFEKMKFEGQLGTSKKEYDELKEMLVKLNADHRLLIGREKKLQEMYQELEHKLDNVEKEKTRITSEFNDKIEEKNQTLVELNDKIVSLKEEKNQTILEFNEKMEVLKEEKNQIVIECNGKFEAFKQEMEGKREVYKQHYENLMNFKKEMGKIKCANFVSNSLIAGRNTGPQPPGKQLASEARGIRELIHPSGDDDVPTGLPTRFRERGLVPEKSVRNECSGLDIEQTGIDGGGIYLIAKRKRSTRKRTTVVDRSES